MQLRLLARPALHLLLALCLVLPSAALQARGLTDALQTVATAAADEMPRDSDGSSQPEPASPCDCCPQPTCDLSACVGTGCLPRLPNLIGYLAPAMNPLPWQSPAAPSAPVDTPLRPPIV